MLFHGFGCEEKYTIVPQIFILLEFISFIGFSIYKGMIFTLYWDIYIMNYIRFLISADYILVFIYTNRDFKISEFYLSEIISLIALTWFTFSSYTLTYQFHSGTQCYIFLLDCMFKG